MEAEHEVGHGVLGVPVRIVTDHPGVLEVAERAFGRWAPEPGSGDPVTVRVRVRPGGAAGPLPPPDFTVDPGRSFELRLGENHAISRVEEDAAQLAVTEALLREADVFRHTLLEGMTLFLVTRRDRCPLHAAALVEDGRALLLAAPSGSGKSTLTYAAFRAGLRVLAEDTVFVQTGPPVRVWGLPGFLHLLPDAVRFFPELRGRAPAMLPNGKEKLVVDLRPDGLPERPSADRAGICLVEQGPALRVERLAPDEAAAAVAGNTAGGFGYFAEEMRPAVEAIGARGCWRLVVPGEPAKAVPALREMMQEL